MLRSKQSLRGNQSWKYATRHVSLTGKDGAATPNSETLLIVSYCESPSSVIHLALGFAMYYQLSLGLGLPRSNLSLAKLRTRRDKPISRFSSLINYPQADVERVFTVL